MLDVDKSMMNTKELFENYGGYSGIGTVWYLDYNQIITLYENNLSRE